MDRNIFWDSLLISVLSLHFFSNTISHEGYILMETNSNNIHKNKNNNNKKYISNTMPVHH